MKIVVFGTGGVGGFYGGALALAGRNVHFIARGEHLLAMKKNGLRVETDLDLGNFHLEHVSATDNSTEIGVADLILVCLKTFQIEAAIPQLNALVGPKTLILPLENGVNSSEVLSGYFPQAQILRGLTQIISYVAAPGLIRQVGTVTRIVMGEWKEDQLEYLNKIFQEFNVPGIRVEISHEIQSAQWTKFLYIASVAPAGCLAGLPLGGYRSDPHFRQMIEASMKEIVALAKAFDVILPETIVQDSLKVMDAAPAESTTSLQRDYVSGRQTEIEAFSGFVSRECRKRKIHSPINDFFYQSLRPN